jgi:hypothetical protein
MIGQVVHDYALGKNGIVVGGPFTEQIDIMYKSQRPLKWEWCVLYEDGELMGAETMDLVQIVEGWITK